MVGWWWPSPRRVTIKQLKLRSKAKAGWPPERGASCHLYAGMIPALLTFMMMVQSPQAMQPQCHAGACEAARNVPPDVHREIDGITAQAFADPLRPNALAFADPLGPNALSLWRRVLQLNPRDANGLVHLGIRLVDSTIDSDKSDLKV